jgi:hypothetical protein
MADKGTLGTGHTKERDVEEKQSEDDNSGSVDVVGKMQNILVLRDLLLFSERKTGIPSKTADFYEYTPIYAKMPVRVESVGVQPVPNHKQISFGWFWTPTGTGSVTAPTHHDDPITGVQDFETVLDDWCDLSYDPSSIWSGSGWASSHAGRIFHTIDNNVRSHKHISLTDMQTMVKALIGYIEMALAVMWFTSYFRCRLDGYLNQAVSRILISDGGSQMFVNKDAIMSQIGRVFAENWFPYPVFDFWKDRFMSVYSQQFDWYKYLLYIPYDKYRYLGGLARIFDAWLDDTVDLEMYHPETFLREEGLFDLFRDNFLPLLWGIGANFTKWVGVDVFNYLKNINFKPLKHNAVELQFIQKAFWLWPFDEAYGIGLDHLPQNWDDDDIGLVDWYMGDGYQAAEDWEQPGQTIYVYPDAYLFDRFGRQIVHSPWLDLEMWCGNQISNYWSDEHQPAEHGIARTLRGQLNYEGTSFSELDYDEVITYFPDLFFRCTELETIKPDPDIDIITSIDGTPRFLDLIKYHDVFCVPYRQPPARWYMTNISGVRRKLKKFYSGFLGLTLDDIEIYKQQRELPRHSGSQV